MLILALFAAPAEATDRQVMLEVYTGSWCQFCPDGQVRADELAANWGERLVVVNVHEGDAMAFSPSPIQEVLPEGYPMATIDRGTALSRGIWADTVAARLAEPAGAVIEVEQLWNGLDRTASLTVTATFEQASPAATQIRLYVVEDGLTGEGTGWDQVNYYNTEPGHLFFGQGNPIVGYVHPRVLRLLPVGQADDGAVEAGVDAGHVEVETYEVVVPEHYDVHHLSFVAFVMDAAGASESRRVWNVVSAPLIVTAELSLAWAGTDDTALDLGDLRVGESLSRTFTVTNEGPAYALLGDLTVDSSDLSADADSCSGENLAPEATCEVTVTWTAAGALDATLTLPFNSDGEVAAFLTGEGDLAPVSQDDFYSVVAGETLDVESPGVLTNDTDPDGGVILPSIVEAIEGLTMADNGAFSLATSVEDAGTTLTFTYVTEDYVGLGNVATVTVEVTAPEAEDTDGGETEPATGCGCQTGGAPIVGWGAVLLALRRRRGRTIGQVS